MWLELSQTTGVFCLETPRLILRDFVPEDWKAVLAYQSEPEYLQYYPWTGRTETDVRAFVRIFLDWQRANPRFRYQLAVVHEATGQVIGNGGIRCAREGAPVAELGYELAPAYWGQGYATEAAGALMEFGFRELGLQRVEANCNAENVASSRVLEKLGFEMVVRHERAVYFKGRWWDTLQYAAVRESRLSVEVEGLLTSGECVAPHCTNAS